VQGPEQSSAKLSNTCRKREQIRSMGPLKIVNFSFHVIVMPLTIVTHSLENRGPTLHSINCVSWQNMGSHEFFEARIVIFAEELMEFD